jgi:hypothetical protein
VDRTKAGGMQRDTSAIIAAARVWPEEPPRPQSPTAKNVSSHSLERLASGHT